jgi:hypothetical protein
MLVFSAILMVGLAYALVYVWQRRLPSGFRKYGWQRWALVAFTATLAVGLASAGVLPASRGFLVHEVYGFSRTVPSAQSPGIQVASSRRFYRIVLPVDNNLSRDQQLNQMSVSMTYETGSGCAEAPYYIYRLQDTIVVKKATGHAQGNITERSGIASGFDVRSTGEWRGGCGPDQVYFRFIPTGLTLKKLSTTMIAIDVPTRMHVKFEVYPARAIKPSQTQVRFPSSHYLSFRVVASASGGTKLDSCFIFKAGRSTERRPLKKCNSLTSFYHGH